jgi:phosphoribosylformylglycinamidine synthase
MARKVKAIVIAGNGTNCEREVANACAGRRNVISSILPNFWQVANVSQAISQSGGRLSRWRRSWERQAERIACTAALRGGNERYTISLALHSPGKLSWGLQRLIDDQLGCRHGRRWEQSATDLQRLRPLQDHWIIVNPPHRVFTKVARLYLPVRLGNLSANSAGATRTSTWRQAHCHCYAPTMDCLSPNGSLRHCRLCGETGRFFGVMPHPEAYAPHHHPRWTRRNLGGGGAVVLPNAVEFIDKNSLIDFRRHDRRLLRVFLSLNVL